LLSRLFKTILFEKALLGGTKTLQMSHLISLAGAMTLHLEVLDQGGDSGLSVAPLIDAAVAGEANELQLRRVKRREEVATDAFNPVVAESDNNHVRLCLEEPA
jgi:hypothetical protein